MARKRKIDPVEVAKRQAAFNDDGEFTRDGYLDYLEETYDAVGLDAAVAVISTRETRGVGATTSYIL